MAADLDAVRSRVEIVDLVSERVKLTRSGKNFRGLCPFHSEKTPSFYVYPEQGRFFCFGCQAAGDVFDWVMRTHGLDFRPAAEYLARKVGVELAGRGGAAADERERLYQVLEEAALFFRQQVESDEAASSYLASRGLTPEVVRGWEIGYAPNDGESLIAHLRRKRISLADAFAAGLLLGSQAAGFRPFFQGRLMFPIRNDRGRIVGFGGRALYGSEPKYLNSKDSPVFSKSQTLFGLHKAKTSIREKQRIVLVEGYLDAIACHRAGVTEATAPLGTALNDRHAAVIDRLCNRAVLAYDGDEAGRKAASRAAMVLKRAGVSSQIVRMPEGTDPDSLLSVHGASALQAAIEAAVTPLEFEVQLLKERHSVKPGQAGRDFWREVTKLLASAPDSLEADRLAVTLAPLHENARYDLRGTIAALKKDVAALRAKRPQGRRVTTGEVRPSASIGRTPLPRPAERVVLRAAIRPEFREAVWGAICEEGLLISAVATEMAQKLRVAIGADSDLDPGSVVASLDDESRSLLTALERPSEGPVTDKVVADALARLHRERELREQRERVSEGAPDDELLKYVRIRAKRDV